MHPTGPILAFQFNIPEIFSEALIASPAYMVATPMNDAFSYFNTTAHHVGEWLTCAKVCKFR